MAESTAAAHPSGRPVVSERHQRGRPKMITRGLCAASQAVWEQTVELAGSDRAA